MHFQLLTLYISIQPQAVHGQGERILDLFHLCGFRQDFIFLKSLPDFSQAIPDLRDTGFVSDLIMMRRIETEQDLSVLFCCVGLLQ